MAWFHRGGLLRSTTQEDRLYDLYLPGGGGMEARVGMVGVV